MFQPHVRNGFHGVLKVSIEYNDIVILNIQGVDYCCIIIGISKSKAVNVFESNDSRIKMEHKLKIILTL